MAHALRDYQVRDLAKLREKIAAGARRILFVATVSYGKTITFRHVAHAHADRGQNVLILAHRTRLVKQAVGRIGTGGGRITIGTVQGVSRRLGRIPRPAVIVVDEVHRGGAGGQYRKIYEAFPDALLLGFTGSPTAGLGEVFDDIVLGESAEALTAQGHIAPVLYSAVSAPDLAGVGVVGGDYDPAQLLAAVERSRLCGDAIDSYRQHCVGRPTILFTINVKHTRAVAAEFAAAGFAAEVITGEDDEDEQERKVGWLRDGGLLIAIDTISEGFDLPDLHAVITLRPTRSLALWLQQTGRVARAAPGKRAGYVSDHANNTLRLGTITEPRAWTANGAAEEDDPRRTTEDGERLSLRRCMGCYLITEAGPASCPGCGAEFGRERRISKAKAAELRAIAEEDIRRIREDIRRARAREGPTAGATATGCASAPPAGITRHGPTSAGKKERNEGREAESHDHLRPHHLHPRRAARRDHVPFSAGTSRRASSDPTSSMVPTCQRAGSSGRSATRSTRPDAPSPAGSRHPGSDPACTPERLARGALVDQPHRAGLDQGRQPADPLRAPWQSGHPRHHAGSGRRPGALGGGRGEDAAGPPRGQPGRVPGAVRADGGIARSADEAVAAVAEEVVRTTESSEKMPAVHKVAVSATPSGTG